MSDLFVLVHAPVLGPRSWAPVAGQLARRGLRAVVPSLAGFAGDGPPYAPRLLERARAQLPDHPAARVVLVVHSGAGEFAPYLAGSISSGQVAVVFADAALPPAHGSGRVVGPEFLPFLRAMTAGDGMVPPWPQWWPEEDLAPLFPGQQARQSVTSEAPPLPLAFFEESLPPVPASWRSCPCGYLRFSEGYREPARQAGERGWPVRELPGEHLHMLADPAGVAAAIVTLAAETQPSKGPG